VIGNCRRGLRTIYIAVVACGKPALATQPETQVHEISGAPPRQAALAHHNTSRPADRQSRVASPSWS